jgi:hypothetical protein
MVPVAAENVALLEALAKNPCVKLHDRSHVFVE